MASLSTMSPLHTHTPQADIADESESRLHYFNEIMKISLNLKDLSTQSHVHPFHFQPPPPITISLPAPNPIASKLLQTGLDTITIERLSLTFVEKAHKLRENLETSIRQGCAELAKVPSKSVSQIMGLQNHLYRAIGDIYSRQLEKWTTELVQRGLDTASKLRQRQHGEKPPLPKLKTAFNHHHVPFLEQYFAENPLPTHADKNFLAKKCDMTFKQIHVWFQNRRNRTRKEGQKFKRKPRNEAFKLPLDAMIAKTPYSIIPENQRKPYVEDEELGYEWQYESDEEDVSEWRERYPRDPNAKDILDLPAAPHAFPIPYPPYDMLFPEGWKPSFPPPQWERQATKPSTKCHPPVDFVALTELFSKLSVAEVQKRRWKVKRSEADHSKILPPAPKPDRSAATIFITTRPPCAPLAAMHKPAALPCAAFSKKFHYVSTSPSRKRAFDTDTSSKPYTLLTRPSEVALPRPPNWKPSSPRKVAQLPRRVPKGVSITHHEPITNSSTSVTTSPSPRKQKSSASSDIASSDSESSKRIRLSSDSSSGSGSGSDIATPEQIPHALPVNIEPPAIAGYDFGRQMLNFPDIAGCQPYYGYDTEEFNLSDVLSSEALLQT